MRYFLLIAATLCLAVPAWAEDSASEDGASVAQRLELAEKMHEIWPIRLRVESAIETVAQSFPPTRQAEVKAAMRKNIQFDQIQEESIKAMVDTYTAEELQAMIDFYGSEVGRSVSAKTSDYELSLRPSMMKMMDKAMLDLRTGSKP